jgi:hypothetical protein
LCLHLPTRLRRHPVRGHLAEEYGTFLLLHACMA